MKNTVFTTPILSPFFRLLSAFFMRLFGWRVEGTLPNIPKYVLIGAHHTSSMDFPLFLGVVFQLKINVRFMGKEELFRWPVAWFFRWCGGVPVARKKSIGLVEQMVDAYEKSDNFILVIAPEGTRYHVNEWKMGFYYIAKKAGVPIVMAVVDGKKKTVHVGQVFHPTENMDADIKVIKGYFEGMVGLNQKNKYITLPD